MQFSLAKLMLLPVAFGLAYLITPESTVRGVGNVDLASWELSSLQESLQSVVTFRKKDRFDVDGVNAWLAGQTANDQDTQLLWEYHGRTSPTPDPWGQAYRFVQEVDSETGRIVRRGFYSCGRDGLTQSDGNDPGDISTWSNSWQDFYDHSGKRWRARERLTSAAIISLFVFLGLLALGKLWRVTALPQRCSVKEDGRNTA